MSVLSLVVNNKYVELSSDDKFVTLQYEKKDSAPSLLNYMFECLQGEDKSLERYIFPEFEQMSMENFYLLNKSVNESYFRLLVEIEHVC